MTYQDALAYLDSFVDYERTHQPSAMRAIRLDRMRELCQRLGEPQRRFRSILVAGTNGKGSICAMLYSMLGAGALRAGLYTSPHLEEVRERIRMTDGPLGDEGQERPDEDWISEADFAGLVEELRPIFETYQGRSPDESLTYFEIMTAMAFVYFCRRQVEVAVIEVGLGGRLDATNILEPAVSILGSIDVDHADVLGEDPVLIGKEKAGIIKPRQTVITVPQQPGVTEMIRAACDAQAVPLLSCGHDFAVSVKHHAREGLQVSIVGLRGIYQSVDIPLIGRHQAANAAVAVVALESLSDGGVPYSSVERGLAGVDWPGRLEVISECPTVILDGAHNPSAAYALRTTIEELWPERTVHLLMGISSDKPVEALAKILGPITASVTCSASGHPRALDPATLAERIKPFFPDVHVVPALVDAYTYLLNTVDQTDVIVVTGSLFFIGELRGILRRAHVKPRRVVEQA